MTKTAPRRWRRFLHLRPYRRGNSVPGLDYAVRHGYPAVDLDAQVSRDGTVWCFHWPKLWRDRYTAKGISRRARVRGLPDAELARVRSTDGYQPHPMTRMIYEATRRGLRVELEVKDDERFEDPATYRDVASLSRWIGAVVVVKTVSHRGDASARLKAAKAAGFDTMLLVRGPWSPSRWIDYVRGAK